MSILTSIPVQNGLLLAIVPSMRSFLDWSGNSHTVTPTATVWARRNGVFGLEYPVGANLTIPHHADFESADKSIFIGGKLDTHHYFDTLIIKQAAGNYTFYAYLTVAGVSIYNGPVEADWTFSKAGMRSCCITHQAAQKATLYKNGALMGLSHLAIDWQGSTGDIEVSNSDVLYPLRQPNYTRSILWYNRALTADENSDLAGWSDSLTSPSLPADRRYFDMGSMVPIGPETQYGPVGDDVMTDGDMEAVGTAAYTTSPAGTLTKSTDNPHSGTQALRVAYLALDTPAARQTMGIVGVPNRVQGWGRGDGINNFQVYLGGLTIHNGTASTSWQYFDTTVIPGSGGMALFSNATGASPGWAEFDDITVRQTNNLLSDGDMEADGVDEWTAGASATLTKETGTLYQGIQVLRIAHNGAANPHAYQNCAVIGRTYRITGAVRSDGVSVPKLYWGGVTLLWTGTTSTSWQTFDVESVCTHTTLYLFQTLGVAGYSEWDNVYVRKVFETVGAWDFGDVTRREVADRSSTSGPGVLNGILSTVQTIVGQSARNFGIMNSSAGVTLPAIVAQDDFAVEALVYLRSHGAVAGRLFQSTNLYVYFSGTRIFLVAVGVTGSAWFSVLNSFQMDRWFHLVVTRRRSDGAVAIYVDGASVLSTTGGTEALDWGGVAYLLNNAGTRAMDGDCQFIRLLNRYMEADEVKRRYAPIARKVMYELGDYLLPTLADVTAGQMIPGTQLRAVTGTWAVPEDVDGLYLECVAAGKLREQLPGAAHFATDLFDATGTAALTKNAGDIEIDAGITDTVRAVRLTLGVVP